MTETFQVDCRGRTARVEIAGEGPDIVIVGTAVPMTWARESCTELAELGSLGSWKIPQRLPRSLTPS